MFASVYKPGDRVFVYRHDIPTFVDADRLSPFLQGRIVSGPVEERTQTGAIVNVYTVKFDNGDVRSVDESDIDPLGPSVTSGWDTGVFIFGLAVVIIVALSLISALGV